MQYGPSNLINKILEIHNSTDVGDGALILRTSNIRMCKNLKLNFFIKVPETFTLSSGTQRTLSRKFLSCSLAYHSNSYAQPRKAPNPICVVGSNMAMREKSATKLQNGKSDFILTDKHQRQRWHDIGKHSGVAHAYYANLFCE